MNPDAQMAAAYAALQAGQSEAVLSLLLPLDSPALRAERPRLVARVLAWRAQALMATNALEAARIAVLEALRLARSAGESDALPELRELHGRISASFVALEESRRQRAMDAALSEMPEAELFASPDPDVVADLLTRQAVVLWENGRSAEARRRIQQAAERAQSPRAQVLAGLGRARMEAPEQHIVQAWRIADTADDINLIAAVAQAARAAKVCLPGPGEI